MSKVAAADIQLQSGVKLFMPCAQASTLGPSQISFSRSPMNTHCEPAKPEMTRRHDLAYTSIGIAIFAALFFATRQATRSARGLDVTGIDSLMSLWMDFFSGKYRYRHSRRRRRHSPKYAH